MSRRIDTLFGQNVGAAIVLVAVDLGRARGARQGRVGALFSGGTSISIVDFMVISVIGAIISSIVVLVITVAVAAFCARRSLDLDNVAAPIVTAAGDIATLPSLFLATYLVGFRFVTPVDRDPVRGARASARSWYAHPVEAADPAPHRARVAARSSCSRASSTCWPA